MAEPFKDIASKLIPGTLQPSATAGHIGAIGAALASPILQESREFRGLEKKDIAAGEYAASPYRMDLTKQAGAVFGRKEWSDLAGEFENKRQELLDFKPGAPAKITKVPKMRKIEIDFNRESLRGMKPGDQIKIGNTTIMKNKAEGSGWAFRTDDMKPGDWAPSKFGGADGITGLFGQKMVSEEAIPGEFEEKSVGGGGKTKAQVQKEMQDLRIRINRVIPSKTELERMLARGSAIQPEGAGKGPRKGRDWDKETDVKFKAYQAKLNDKTRASDMIEDQQKKHSEIPFESIQGYYRSVLEDNNFSLLPHAIKRGAAQNMENAISNSLSDISPEMVDGAIQLYRDDINKNIQAINKMPNEADKLLSGYELLLRVAPLAQNAEEAVIGAVGDGRMLAALQGAVINPEKDFALGTAALPKMQKDFNNMTKVILKNNVPGFEQKGEGLFNELVDSIRSNVSETVLPKKFLFFRKGTTSESIREIVQKNLVEDPKLSRMAPSTIERFNKPNPTEKKWLALFYSAYGKPATFADVSFTPGGHEAAREEKRAKELNVGDFGD